MKEAARGKLPTRTTTPSEVAEAHETLGRMRELVPEEKRSILELKAEGYSSKDIGERLGISERTVQRVLEELRRRMETEWESRGMNLSAGRRTWEEAASPAAVLLARKYEQAWRDSDHAGRRPSLHVFRRAGPAIRATARGAAGAVAGRHGAAMGDRREGRGAVVSRPLSRPWRRYDRRACLRRVLSPRGRRRTPGCRRVSGPLPRRSPGSLARVLQIHDLVGSGTPATVSPNSIGDGATTGAAIFPEAGQTIGGFSLVEELGRGAFARVFLAKERQLADRPVALKVTRRGSREPQTLARLQHTHIVPVYSHRIDAATGLHLLCMPYFGRLTLARILADPEVQAASSGEVAGPCARPARAGGVAVVAALDRPRGSARAILSAGDRVVGGQAGRGAGPRPRPRRTAPRRQAVQCSGHSRRHADAARLQPAREPVFEDETPGGEPILGGTIDYMPPRALESPGRR